MEVLYVVQGVRDVIGQVHHRAFQGLPPGRKLRKRSQRVEHLGQIDQVGRELRSAGAASTVPSTPRRYGPLGRMILRIVEARPGILQYGGPYCRSEVEPLVAGALDFELGQNPEGLGVALEAIRKAESLSGKAIEDPLAEMAERRMTKIVSICCRLHHDMIKSAKITKQVPILGPQQPYGDGARNGGHLDRVRQAVVHHAAGGCRIHHLGHLRQPREGLSKSDPFQVGAELRFPRCVRTLRLWAGASLPGIHVRNATRDERAALTQRRRVLATRGDCRRGLTLLLRYRLRPQ